MIMKLAKRFKKKALEKIHISDKEKFIEPTDRLEEEEEIEDKRRWVCVMECLALTALVVVLGVVIGLALVCISNPVIPVTILVCIL